MKNIYLILVLLLCATRAIGQESHYVHLPEVISLYHVVDIDQSWTGIAVTNEFLISFGNYSIKAFRYEGISGSGDKQTVLESINRSLQEQCGDKITCVDITGVSQTMLPASKGFIYFRVAPVTEPDIEVCKIEIVNENTGSYTCILQVVGWDLLAPTSYAVKCYHSGQNVTFTATGTFMPTDMPYHLRKVTATESSYESGFYHIVTLGDIAATLPAAPQFNQSTIPSATFSVPNALLEEGGQYVLMYGDMVASNIVTVGGLSPDMYEWSYAVSESTVTFNIEGPLYGGETYEVYAGDHQTTVESFILGADTSSTSVSCIFRNIAGGNYVLRNNGVITSNSISLPDMRQYEWLSHSGEATTERVHTLDKNGDMLTMTALVPLNSDITLLYNILNDKRFVVQSNEYGMTFRLVGETRRENDIELQFEIKSQPNTGLSAITLSTGFSDRILPGIPNKFVQDGGGRPQPTVEINGENVVIHNSGTEFQYHCLDTRGYAEMLNDYNHDHHMKLPDIKVGDRVMWFGENPEWIPLLVSGPGNGSDLILTPWLRTTTVVESERVVDETGLESGFVVTRVLGTYNLGSVEDFLILQHFESGVENLEFTIDNHYTQTIALRKQMWFTEQTLRKAIDESGGGLYHILSFTDHECLLEIKMHANITQSTIYQNTTILGIPFEIESAASIRPLLTYTKNGRDSYDIRLSNSYPNILHSLKRTYKNYKGDSVQDDKGQLEGTGEAIVFENVSGNGLYELTVYSNYGGFKTIWTFDPESGGMEFAGGSNGVETHSYITPEEAVIDVQFVDGFGRVHQEVAVAASPDGAHDIVTPHVYGVHGRIEREYLPFVATATAASGHYHTNQLTADWSIYGTDGEYAFSITVYDDSPLNRVIKQIGQGQTWHSTGSGVATNYSMNGANEVRKYRVDDAGDLVLDGYYDAGTLQKAVTTDEEGRSVATFTDNQNTILLSSAAEGLDTYSIYDDCGLLRWVLSPEASAGGELEKFAYYYEYDPRGRMTLKRLPGAEPVVMRYDTRDRMIMSQDGNQRTTGMWSYSIYDKHNRVVETGEIVPSEALTEGTIPAGVCTPLQYTLYDSYEASADVPVHAFVATEGFEQGYNPMTAGLVTSIRTRILGTDDWLTTTSYYDEKGRLVQSAGDNVRGGVSRVDMGYDFVGNVVKQREQHEADVVETEHCYDKRGRLLSSSTRLNGGTPATVSYGYDNLGRLTSQQMGSITEQLDYNVRGWLTSKSSEVFNMQLGYAQNGNVSTWGDYSFSYDAANRLVEAASLTGYSEQGISYDRNGNILGLTRLSAWQPSHYVNEYDGNKLVASNGQAFGYDANGNMTSDGRKGLGFQYNCLNLIDEASENGARVAKYDWLADGTKLKVRNAAGIGFDYVGSLIYGGNGVEARFAGGVIRQGNGQEVNYHLTDHLGSVRVVVDAASNIRERNDYYPFGAQHVRADYPQNTNRLKFNGKEIQTTGDLKFLDYGVRMFDQELGRWFNMDPLSEQYPAHSPYHFTLNNPLSFVDPNGAFSTHYVDENYNLLLQTKDGSDNVVFVPSEFQDVMRFYAKNYAAWEHDLNDPKWNQFWFSQGFSMADRQFSDAEIAVMDLYTSDKSRNAAAAFFLKPTFGNMMTAGWSEVLSQWTNPEKLVMAASIGIGGLGALARLSSAMKGGETALIHGNSLKSMRPTWGYKLYSNDGTFLKNGITSKPIPETRYTRLFMQDKHMKVEPIFPNRKAAWQWEYQQNLILKGPLNKNMH